MKLIKMNNDLNRLKLTSYIIILSISILNSCTKSKYSKNCGEYFFINSKEIVIDTIITLDPETYQKERWIYKKYYMGEKYNVYRVDCTQCFRQLTL